MIILHSGLHKTGSTAIQTMLFSREFQRSGIAVSGRPNNFARSGTLNDLWVQRVRAASNKGLVVVSATNLLGNYEDMYGSTAERIQRFQVAFSQHEVKVVVYLREHTTWLRSIYAHTIQQGGHQTPDQFVKGVLSKRNLPFHGILREIRSAFPEAELCPRIVPQGDFNSAMDFIQLLGSNNLAVSRFPRANRSLKLSTVVALRRLNEVGSRTPASQTHLWQLLRDGKTGVRSDQESLPLSIATAESLQSTATRDAQALSRDFGVNLPVNTDTCLITDADAQLARLERQGLFEICEMLAVDSKSIAFSHHLSRANKFLRNPSRTFADLRASRMQVRLSKEWEQ